MGEPLLRWTRPLSAEEGRADRAADVEERLERFVPYTAGDPAKRDDMLPGRWLPVLPAEIPQCALCTLPNRERICGRCIKLLRQLGRPIDSLEFLAMAGKRDLPERLIWDWKEEAARLGMSGVSDSWLVGVAASLSAYLEAHAGRLLAGEPLVTAVPSRVPLIAAAFRLAASRGWHSVEVNASGRKCGDWAQHTTAGQAERLARTASDWSLDVGRLAARPVLLFDDVLVTGASLFSYATALKRAGAGEVRSVAVVRHLDGRSCDYHDALRILRRTRSLDWSPSRGAIARLCELDEI